MKFFNAFFFLGIMYAMIISNSFQLRHSFQLRSRKFTFIKINSALTGEMIESGFQLAFNAAPIAVGIYVLTAQDKSQRESLTAQDKSQKESLTALKESLAAQDKSQKESLTAQDKSQRESLTAQDKSQKESLTALEKLFRDNLIAEKLMWSERFDNFLRRSNFTTS
jgi:hypothetical protein